MCDLSGAYKEKIRQLEAENSELKARLNPPEPPPIKGTITYQVITKLYKELFPKHMDKVFISDEDFEITTISELRRFVKWDEVNLYPYISEFHDCDDFALALAGDFAKYPEWSGFPVTYIWGSFLGGHAFVTAVAWPSLADKTPTVYFIEPQNDVEIAREQVEEMELWLMPMKKR